MYNLCCMVFFLLFLFYNTFKVQKPSLSCKLYKNRPRAIFSQQAIVCRTLDYLSIITNLNESWWYLITSVTPRAWFSVFLDYGSHRNSMHPRSRTPTLGHHQINSPIPQYQHLLHQRLFQLTSVSGFSSIQLGYALKAQMLL